MYKLKTFLQTKPVFLLLLPVFFVLHGYTEYHASVPAAKALIVTLKYLAGSLVLLALSWLLLKNPGKAALYAAAIMSYYLFFGVGYDQLQRFAGHFFISKYVFIFPATLVILIVLAIYLKRTKNKFPVLIKYLNYLFLLLILIDAGILFFRKTGHKAPAPIAYPTGLSNYDSTSKPDIYLIIADEYASSEQLQRVFNFSNEAFESELIKKGFHIIQNAKSNYNSTPFSVASLLSMNYIDSVGNSMDVKKLDGALGKINNNILIQWLQEQGYEIRNYSAFPLANIPNPENSTFFFTGTSLITQNTLGGRFNRDLRWNLITRFKIKSEIKKFVSDKMHNTRALLDMTANEASLKKATPRFVYLHLMLPHFPYLVDEKGTPDYTTSFLHENRFSMDGYLGYLKYSNKLFLSLIDSIRLSSPGSVIIFAGDHGFRHQQDSVDTTGHFMSFNSVYLPGKNYTGFYDGMSLVNEFRVILNTQFKQRLELLKDSTVFITNW